MISAAIGRDMHFAIHGANWIMSNGRDKISSTQRTRVKSNVADCSSNPDAQSGHVDTFVREHLPPQDLWPVMSTHGLPELEYPMRLNAAEELLDSHIAQGHGASPCLRTDNFTWTYQQLLDHANRMANLLVNWGLAPGERVLLRDANTPMLVASWFAVLKAGGIAVTTMIQLRAHELTAILNKARTKYAICAREH